MGRLAGFRYRQIIKRLKKLGFEFDRQAAGAPMRYGSTPGLSAIPRFPIILAICRKARYAPLSNKPASPLRRFRELAE